MPLIGNAIFLPILARVVKRKICIAYILGTVNG